MKVFNLYLDEWDEPREREGWRIKEAFVGHHIGGKLIGASMSEVEAGNKLWPYHTHYANEEWVMVLRGEPTLRTPEGEHVLKEGDVACFPRGEAGAHQIINRTDAPIRVLMLSSMVAPDIVQPPRAATEPSARCETRPTPQRNASRVFRWMNTTGICRRSPLCCSLLSNN
jgi:uncharacterized cupin superfamily protein